MKIVNQLLFSSWIVCAMCACTNEEKINYCQGWIWLPNK